MECEPMREQRFQEARLSVRLSYETLNPASTYPCSTIHANHSSHARAAVMSHCS